MNNVFHHGIYRGETHDAVADINPKYIIHCVEKGDKTIDRELYKACVDAVEEQDDDNPFKELSL